MTSREIILFYILLIITLISCSKEEDDDNLIAKPAGRYLSEIGVVGILSGNAFDTVWFAKFEYNKKRYIDKIRFRNAQLRSQIGYQKYFYNNRGKVDYVNSYSQTNYFLYKDTFTYENQKLTLCLSYSYETYTKTLMGKRSFTTDSVGRITEEFYYDNQRNNWNEIMYSIKYFYDSNGNMIKSIDNFDPRAPNMDEYEFDNMKNPFAGNDIALTYYFLPFFWRVDYLSVNNEIKRKHTSFYTFGESISYVSTEQTYENNFPVKENGYYRLLYKYINLK